jgi:acetylornithine deacetylase/succinyl-diaminopimelate desuccinylase-like protein
MNGDRLLGLIDRKLVVDLAAEMVNTPSGTGNEGDMARLLGRALRDVGCRVTLQNLYDDRYNTIGRLDGRGHGPTVLLSGHLDTSVRGDEDYLIGKGWKNTAVVEPDRVWGNGIGNMKQAFVSYIAGLDALRRAEIQLDGDLIVAGTAGEIELAAVDEFQGKNYDAYGVGLRYLLTHGVAADFNILGEPTGQTPSIGMMGTVWAKVTTHGQFAHTAFMDMHASAIDEMWLLWQGLNDWIEGFCERNTFMNVRPQVNRAAVRGGLPWRAARTANICHLYIDVRFPPTRYPIDVQREFTLAVRKIASDRLRLSVDVEFYMSRGGTLIARESPVVQAMVEAHRDITGNYVEPTFSPPYCTDAIDANRLGIPTVVYGSGLAPGRATDAAPGDPRAAEGEFVLIDDMVNAAAAYMNATIRLNKLDTDRVMAVRGSMPGVMMPAESPQGCKKHDEIGHDSQ